MKYKCIPAPQVIKIEKGWNIAERMANQEKAVHSFADLINKETSKGWKFHSMESIAIIEEPGCFSALFGRKSETTYFNMLVFSNENDLAISEDQNVKSSSTNENSNAENKSSTQIGNNQIKITRLKSAVGSALLVDIRVDNQSHHLENGEEKVINVENGKHIITASFNNDYEKLEFEINNDKKSFEIIIKPPLKLTMV